MTTYAFLARTTALSAVFAGTLAASGWADPKGFVIGNRNYARLDTFGDANDVMRMSSTLERAGFEVERILNAKSGAAYTMLAKSVSEVRQGEAVVYILAGHFTHSDSETYFLPTNISPKNVVNISQAAVPLSAILQSAKQKAPYAAVLLAPSDDDAEMQFGLENGVGDIDAPQGVLVAIGGTQEIQRFLQDGLLDPEMTIEAAIRREGRGLEVFGYASPEVPFLPREEPPASAGSGDPGELAYWTAAKDIGTEAALQAYLDRYPNGRFVDQARADLRALERSPEQEAQDREAALNLSRDERREVQRALQILDFNPRGIDGIFGRGTRGALRDWQTSRFYEPTGYLNEEQLRDLRRAAADRSRELEAEAERRRIEQERADRAYWRRNARDGGEAELRTYLERFPDGLYSDEARERLNEIEAERRAAAAADERRAWTRVQERDSPDAYREFLNRYPDGSFAVEARQRLAELTRSDDERAAEQAAAEAEARILNNPVTRLLVEKRLEQLKLDPGPADGRFDDNTRRAIRKFQRDRDLTPTGYVDQRTAALLLTFSIRP